MESIYLKAAISGGTVFTAVAFLKSQATWINGWRTWLVAAILSAGMAWVEATTAVEPTELATSVMFGVWTFIVGIGGNIGLAKAVGGDTPTLKVNKPNGGQ